MPKKTPQKAPGGPVAPPMNGPAPQAVARNADGTVKPGESLRKKSMRTRAQKLSRRIARETRDASELIDKLLALARDSSHPDHFKAINALLNRYAGKEPQTIELSGPDGQPLQSEATVKHEPPDPKRLANVLGVLARAGFITAPGGTGGPGGQPPPAQ